MPVPSACHALPPVLLFRLSCSSASLCLQPACMLFSLLFPSACYALQPSQSFGLHAMLCFPSIHCSMGSTPVGVQCPLTSSLGEFPGYWDWLWYPGLSPVLVSIAFPFAFHISVFFHCSEPAHKAADLPTYILVY